MLTCTINPYHPLHPKRLALSLAASGELLQSLLEPNNLGLANDRHKLFLAL